MTLSLKESWAAAEMAKVLYDFLPGSGRSIWKGHITFYTVAQEVGVGDFWQGGSKQPAIALLIEKTLEYRRHLFEKLILSIVKAGLTYRQKKKDPIREEEIKTLNGLIFDIGFKFPFLWDQNFLESLKSDGAKRATKIVDQEILAEKVQASKISDFEREREQLRTQFYELYIQVNRQSAGFELEKLLNKLFELYSLSPRGPFRIKGEQIDGSFELDNEVYLLEAKWESPKISEAPLLVFRGKVEGKSSFTRGVFIALNGFTTEALEAITRGKQTNFFLLDGYDLVSVLEGRVRLDFLMRAKLRLLAEEGRIFVSAAELV
jgi:hypothetical protein